MNKEILNNIIHKVNSNPRLGIAIKNNLDNQWIYKFHNLSDIKKKGFNSIEAFLNKIYDTGYDDLTIYLKKPNGTSSMYIKGQQVRIYNASKTNNSNNASTPTTMHNEQTTQQQNGLLGGMNQIQVLDIYTKAQRYDELKPKLDALELESTTNKDLISDLKFEKRMLQRDLEEKPKNTIALDVIKHLADSALPALMNGNVGNVGKVGLKGSEEAESKYTDAKTKLLNVVKHKDFTDDYCDLFSNVINHLIANPNSVQQLINFSNTQTPVEDAANNN